MKKITLATILMLAGMLRLHSATGDIIGAWITTNGYSIRIRVEGANTNGLIEHGLGTNRSAVESARLKLNLTSQTLTTSLSPTTETFQLVGQEPMRYPVPGNAFVDTELSGSDAIIHVALSDYVYAGDSNLTLSCLAGLYTFTNSGPTIVSSASVTGLTVTNLSVASYPAPTANWTIVRRDIATNTVFNLKAFGMDRHAGQNGQPLKAMIFTLTDGTTTLTNTQTSAVRDRTATQDKAVVCEYIAPFVVSNLTQGATLTGQFWAIPFRGTNYLWTGDGVNVEPSTRYCPIRILNDWKFTTDLTNSYGRTVAIVDPATGNNTTAIVQKYHEWQSSPTTNYYATIKAAANAIVASNNTSGFLATTRNDHGAAFILLRPGNYTYTGAATSPTGTMPETFLTITTDTGVTKDQVIFNNTDSVQLRKRTKLSGVTISKTNANFMFGADDIIWLDNCMLDQSEANWGSSCTNLAVTGCTITNFPTLTPIGGPQTISLFRGNEMNRWRGNVTATTAIGNIGRWTNGPAMNRQYFSNDRTGVNEDSTNRIVFAFNILYGVNQTLNHGVDLWANTDNVVDGSLIVQNLIEATGDGASCVMNIGNSTSGQFINIVEAYNSYLGKYIGHYNDQTNVPRYELCVSKGNVTLNDNLKTDTFPTASGLRTNNWSCYMGVGSENNFYSEIDPVGAAGSFPHKSPGLRSIQFASPTTNGVMKYVDSGYFFGTTWGDDVPGNYRFHSTAMAQRISGGRRGFWALPYDIFGNLRSPYDPPGAVTGGSIQQGLGFINE